MPIRHFPITSVPKARPGISRTVVGVLLILQAMLWGGGSIIEARSAAESLSRYTHVEDQDSRACPPLHSHFDCIICRTFASGAITSKSRDLLPQPRRDVIVAAAPAVGVYGGAISGQVGSRAPPVVAFPDRTIA